MKRVTTVSEINKIILCIVEPKISVSVCVFLTNLEEFVFRWN